MADINLTNPQRIIRANELLEFKGYLEAILQSKAIAAIQGLNASTVEGALAELLTKIGTEISAVYKPGGNKTAAELTSALLVEGNLGKVYNLTTDATTTSDWVDGAGETVKAGTDVGVVAVDVYVATEDETAVEGKTYYADANGTALDNQPEAGADISSAGYYEKSVAYKFNAYSVKIDLSGYKTVQSAVSDPTASGNSLSFIDSISQNEQGVITPTKKTVYSAAPSTSGVGGQAGLLSASDKEKLDGVIYATSEDIAEMFPSD